VWSWQAARPTSVARRGSSAGRCGWPPSRLGRSREEGLPTNDAATRRRPSTCSRPPRSGPTANCATSHRASSTASPVRTGSRTERHASGVPPAVRRLLVCGDHDHCSRQASAVCTRRRLPRVIAVSQDSPRPRRRCTAGSRRPRAASRGRSRARTAERLSTGPGASRASSASSSSASTCSSSRAGSSPQRAAAWRSVTDGRSPRPPHRRPRSPTGTIGPVRFRRAAPGWALPRSGSAAESSARASAGRPTGGALCAW
jgi:hypothetical protein